METWEGRRVCLVLGRKAKGWKCCLKSWSKALRREAVRDNCGLLVFGACFALFFVSWQNSAIKFSHLH